MKKLLFLLVFIPLVSFGQTAEDYFKKGLDERMKKNYSSSIYYFNKAIELNNNDYNYYMGRGISRNDLKSYKEAIEDFSLVIKLNPKYGKAYVHRAISIVLESGDPENDSACRDVKVAKTLIKASSDYYKRTLDLIKVICNE